MRLHEHGGGALLSLSGLIDRREIELRWVGCGVRAGWLLVCELEIGELLPGRRCGADGCKRRVLVVGGLVLLGARPLEQRARRAEAGGAPSMRSTRSSSCMYSSCASVTVTCDEGAHGASTSSPSAAPGFCWSGASSAAGMGAGLRYGGRLDGPRRRLLDGIARGSLPGYVA